MRILVTDGMDKAAMETLRGQGHEIVEQFYEPDQLGAALVGMEIQGDGKACGFRDQFAGDMGRTEGMFGKNAAVGDAELNHQFFFPVVCHQRNVHALLLSSHFIYPNKCFAPL